MAAKLPHHNSKINQDCITPLLPCGFVLKLVMWSTWGDPFYVGLTGIEIHDAAMGPILIPSDSVTAVPFSSVAVLPRMASDARTPDKLVRLSITFACVPTVEHDGSFHCSRAVT
jgi:hypothetical protein